MHELVDVLTEEERTVSSGTIHKRMHILAFVVNGAPTSRNVILVLVRHNVPPSTTKKIYMVLSSPGQRPMSVPRHLDLVAVPDAAALALPSFEMVAVPVAHRCVGGGGAGYFRG